MQYPWGKKTKSNTCLSLFVCKQRVDFAVLSEDKRELSVLETEKYNDLGELPQVFEQMLEKQDILIGKVNIVLSTQLYSLLQIDKPQLPDDEMVSALPFMAKEYVSEPVHSLVFDYFNVPNQNKINLVYCAKSVVEMIVGMMTKAKLELANIGIEELATVNLFQVSQDTEVKSSTQMLISQQDFQEVSLTIIYDNQLYFSRKLRGYARLRELTADQFESGLLDNFSLEIQRSADFVVSQLKIPEVKRINLVLPCEQLDALIERVQVNFTIPVAKFEHKLVSQDTDLRFLPVIGGVLEV